MQSSCLILSSSFILLIILFYLVLSPYHGKHLASFCCPLHSLVILYQHSLVILYHPSFSFKNPDYPQASILNSCVSFTHKVPSEIEVHDSSCSHSLHSHASFNYQTLCCIVTHPSTMNHYSSTFKVYLDSQMIYLCLVSSVPACPANCLRCTHNMASDTDTTLPKTKCISDACYEKYVFSAADGTCSGENYLVENCMYNCSDSVNIFYFKNISIWLLE